MILQKPDIYGWSRRTAACWRKRIANLRRVPLLGYGVPINAVVVEMRWRRRKGAEREALEAVSALTAGRHAGAETLVRILS